MDRGASPLMYFVLHRASTAGGRALYLLYARRPRGRARGAAAPGGAVLRVDRRVRRRRGGGAEAAPTGGWL